METQTKNTNNRQIHEKQQKSQHIFKSCFNRLPKASQIGKTPEQKQQPKAHNILTICGNNNFLGIDNSGYLKCDINERKEENQFYKVHTGYVIKVCKECYIKIRKNVHMFVIFRFF